MKLRIERLIRWTMVAILAAGVLLGCTGPNITQGSGRTITESRPVRAVTEVVLAMSGALTIEQTGTEALTVEAEDNIVPLITTDLQGGRLTIHTRPNTSFNNTRPINIRLSVKDLTYIGATASGPVTLGRLQGGGLRAEATGSGSVTLEGLKVERLTSTISGSGGITTVDQVSAQEVTVSGSGRYDDTRLASTRATVITSGSGDALVQVSDRLDATVRGSGSVRYIGHPTLHTEDSGSGEIVPMRAR